MEGKHSELSFLQLFFLDLLKVELIYYIFVTIKETNHLPCQSDKVIIFYYCSQLMSKKYDRAFLRK